MPYDKTNKELYLTSNIAFATSAIDLIYPHQTKIGYFAAVCNRRSFYNSQLEGKRSQNVPKCMDSPRQPYP